MNKFVQVLIISGSLYFSCAAPKTIPKEISKKDYFQSKDTVRIANDEIGYEVIIIDPQFYTWLNTMSLPRSYYTLQFLEGKNQQYVSEWNRRVVNSSYNKNLYDMQINYDATTRYGFEVNYLIYNYFIYFQNRNKQQLFGRVPPR